MPDSKAQYDVVVIGAGPAGFTAGTYLARFRFKTLLLDSLAIAPPPGGEEAGRSTISGFYQNIPGFPEGIERQDLKWRGILHAQNSGCDYRIDKVISVTRHPKHFTLHCETKGYTATTLFFAMGVQDRWPELPGLATYVGQALFLSVESNGKEAEGKEAGVIGHDEYAALSAIRLRDYTEQVTLLTHGEALACSKELQGVLSYLNIPVVESRIKTISETDSCIRCLLLENNRMVNAHVLFAPTQYRIPRSQLAQELGVHVDTAGYIQVNDRFETSLPNTYAVGDITARGPELVIASYFQGMCAAWALYEETFQKRLQHLLVASKELSR